MTLTSICVHQHFRLSLHKQNIQGILSRFAIEEMLQNKRNLLETFKFVFSAQTASCSRFVPKHEPVHDRDVEKLSKFLEDKPNILVLTGAGVSTESGIPDYRSEGVGLYARSGSRPVQHLDFVSSPKVRQRYWARNFVAWPTFSNFQPNTTHLALAHMQRTGRIGSIVTQNVDRLHIKAGAKDVLELHGCGYNVICLGSNCDYSIDRHELQLIFNSLNQSMVDRSELMRPDGDIDIPQEYIDSFRIPDCPKCGGNLKPEIVFFGDVIPKPRAEKLAAMVCSSDGVLILGSSLLVYSGYRVLLHSHEMGLPVAIVNIGKVRGEEKATMKISAKCGDIIPKL